MKKRLLFALIAVILSLTVLFAGCESGIAKETYDKVVAQFEEIKAKYTDALTEYDELKVEKATSDSELQSAQAEIAELETQVAALKAEYELTGATPQETAEKIIKHYYDTHIYTTIDYFVCSDMASEVWNMLKAAGISSIVVVGNTHTAISDILDSDHAWVLAEVSPGQYLALETTGGYSVPTSQNPLYYQGWSFDSPADIKANNDLVKEYNIRVGFRNTLAKEVSEAQTLYNNSSNQAEADKWYALYSKLKQLQTDQETILNNLKTQIYSLAAVLQ